MQHVLCNDCLLESWNPAKRQRLIHGGSLLSEPFPGAVPCCLLFLGSARAWTWAAAPPCPRARVQWGRSLRTMWGVCSALGVRRCCCWLLSTAHFRFLNRTAQSRGLEARSRSSSSGQCVCCSPWWACQLQGENRSGHLAVQLVMEPLNHSAWDSLSMSALRKVSLCLMLLFHVSYPCWLTFDFNCGNSGEVYGIISKIHVL